MALKQDPKWDNIDWSLTTKELQEKLGVSRQRIHQKRPKGVNYRPLSTFKNVNNFIKNVDYRNWRHCATITDIAALEGVTPATLYKYAKSECEKWTHARRNLLFLPINWDLPSAIIEEVWGLPTHKASYRRPKNAKAKWWQNSTDPEYLRAVAKEKQKAKAYYNEK